MSVPAAGADAVDEVHVAGGPEGFRFEVHFTRRVHPQYRPAIRAAADRWAALVTGPKLTGDVPVMMVTTQSWAKKYLASTVPCDTWPADEGPLAGRPSRVEITFNRNHLASLSPAHLQQLAMHEMGHGLGIALSWEGFLDKQANGEWVFTGKQAMTEYGTLLGTGIPTPVPVDNGSLNTHWRVPLFANELMNYKLEKKILPVSSVTLGSLVDLGYEVNVKAADAFVLPKEP